MSEDAGRIAEQAAQSLVRSREETAAAREEIATLRDDPEVQALSTRELQMIRNARRRLH